MVVFIVMAVILSPDDYGILGMCYIWISFMRVFSDLGLPAALIQRQNVTEGHYSSVFYFNIAAGVLLCVMGVALSWPGASFFNAPTVQPVMAVMSICFIVDSFSTTHRVILQKKLKFKTLAIRDLLAALLGGIAGIACALYGLKVWSLVVQALITSAAGTALLWLLSQWRPSWKESSFKHVRELWDYSSKMLASEVLKYLTQNYDRLIIGHLFGAAALGLYTFASKFSVFLLKEPVKAVDAYLFPKFSQDQDNLEQLQSSYFRLLKVANAILAPMAVIIAVTAPYLVPPLFGEKWAESILLIQILSISGLTYSIISPVSVLMKALNHPGWIIIWMIAFTFMAALLMWVGGSFGLVGAIGGLTLVYLLATAASFLIGAKLLRTRLRTLVSHVMPTTAAAAGMGLVLWLILNFGDAWTLVNAMTYIRLISGLVVGSAVYFLILRCVLTHDEFSAVLPTSWFTARHSQSGTL